MKKTGFVLVLISGALAIAFASNKRAAVTPEIPAPRIVAKARLTGQTTSIPNTVVFTPNQSGLYRVSAYMTITSPGPSPSTGWTLQLNWTDGAGFERANMLFAFDNQKPPGAFAGNQQGNPFIVDAVTGTPISYSVTNNGTVGSTYDVFLVVERLP